MSCPDQRDLSENTEVVDRMGNRPSIQCKSIYIRPEYRVNSGTHSGVLPSSVTEVKQSFPGAKVLFVDGDNTLRRRPDGDNPEGLIALQEALRRPSLAGVIVVACGQWKEVLSLDRLRALFDRDISHRLVDRTPDLEEDETGFKPHREIFSWLAAHPEIADYCVLEPFWPMEPHVESAVFILDGYVFGEDPEDVSKLEEFLARSDVPKTRVRNWLKQFLRLR